MIQSGHISPDEALNTEYLLSLLKERFAAVDFKKAIDDITPFVNKRENFELWGEDFFWSVTKDRL